ncbi:RNA polymerase factor sigma-54 [Polymorphobacter megasporae]|uniref:RNA polymerase factor sigma-54 n=1 Tax=Glacieibacterium megasporae TaxID=2835787 RepID=UPI001C1E5957|nr:RNA polymerase factor sigma-54 [Polymorphobacter megasporae]UAJ10180.1 RNA polymerase factor sigma-54 [Polymorphobacter megasporae]
MSIGPRLDLRQSQSLVMTVQLQQAIKLLALTNVELEAYIGGELEKNPLLDVGDTGSIDAVPAATAEPATTDQLIAAGNGAVDAPLDVDFTAETFHHDGPTDSVTDGGFQQGGSFDGAGAIGNGGSGDGEGIDVDAMAAAEPSLIDLLIEQAVAAFADPVDLVIARHLIDQIDDAGYLTGSSVEEIADRLGTYPAAVERVLVVIHSFDPVGVGARTLRECLIVQAREADRLDPAMAALLDNLETLARGDMATLRRVCGVDQEDLSDMIRELRGYNPKPGLQYGGGERAQSVVADVFVHRLAKGGWVVELNSATLPRVLVDRGYHAQLSAAPTGHDAHSKERAREAKVFLSDCLASANWLVKALDQRARTIIKVATELVKQQEAFFEHGVNYLKPLTLRAIAEEIGVHESTVSRVTSNKYLACDRGLFELKYFFTSGIQSNDGGEASSALAVKNRISRLIAVEPPAVPLSDDKLVVLLRAEGFDIARRTVMKYREAMGIGSSVARRRAKLLEAAA